LKVRRGPPITGEMSVEAVMSRIAELQHGLRPSTPGTTPAPLGESATAFTSVLAGQTAGGPTATTAALGAGGATTAGQRALQVAAAEVGVAEQPPGSNDAPRIAQYRQATAGSGVGPWCAYFVSWAAQQAGAPLGEAGQGFGSVGAVAGWAQRTGRWTPAGAGTRPNPGDLIVWGGEHIGLVESVDPDGSIHTIEGNSSNAVTRRTHGADGDGATGYVRVG
jgi:hypothetical protein